MLAIALPLLISCLPALQEPEVVPVDPVVVEATVAQLGHALKRGTTAEKIAALETASAVPDTAVSEAAAEGLKDKNLQVVKAAVEALGWLQQPEGYKALTSYFKRNSKKIAKQDTTLYGALLKAVARHGEVSAVPILLDKPFSVPVYSVIQARILGLGNIRHRDAIEGLVSLGTKVRPNDLDRYMDDFQTALFQLTGENHGKSPRQWGNWWRSVKKTFEVPANPPKMRRIMQEEWDAFWGYDEREMGAPTPPSAG